MEEDECLQDSTDIEALPLELINEDGSFGLVVDFQHTIVQLDTLQDLWEILLQLQSENTGMLKELHPKSISLHLTGPLAPWTP